MADVLVLLLGDWAQARCDLADLGVAAYLTCMGGVSGAGSTSNRGAVPA